MPAIQRYALAVRQGEFEQALVLFSELPKSLQNEKPLLLMRIEAARHASDQDYIAAVDDFSTRYPDDPCVAFHSFHAARLKRDFGQALNAVEQLDRAVGGDPYLNLIRAWVHFDQGHFDRARELLAALEAWDSTLAETQWLYVHLSLKEKNFDETVRRLSSLSDELGVAIPDLTTLPECAEFVKSPQYESWIRSREPAK